MKLLQLQIVWQVWQKNLSSWLRNFEWIDRPLMNSSGDSVVADCNVSRLQLAQQLEVEQGK